MNRRHLLLLCALLCAGNALAQPVELAGVRHPASVSVAGKPLLLNGAGVRYKYVVKVYTAALYLGQRAATPEAVMAAPGPRRLQVTMLRSIDANELGRLFSRGLQDNAPREDMGRLIQGTLRMADVFSANKRLGPGDHFSVDWIPGQGTLILVNGHAQGEPIKEPEFYNALLRIWLGSKPADWMLKDALLGRSDPGASAQL